jgi:hypothetical protein
MATYNALKYTQNLEAAGFSRTEAEATIHMVLETMDDNFATKHDLKFSEHALRTDMQGMELALRSDMKEMGQSIRSEMKEIEQSLRHEMREMESRLTIKMGAMLVASIAIMEYLKT